MKVIGLFIVVFGGLAITKFIGFSEPAMLVGAIVSACSFVLMVK